MQIRTAGIVIGAVLSLSVGFGQGAIERIPDELFPLTTEPKTLTVYLRSVPSVENYASNEFTKWYEEQTGVTADLQVGPSNPTEFQQALNLRLASGDLPDIILGAAVSTSQLALYGQQGIFLPLKTSSKVSGVKLSASSSSILQRSKLLPPLMATSTACPRSTTATTAPTLSNCGSISPG